MNRTKSLLQNWDFCYDKEDWYPPLADALKALTAEQADGEVFYWVNKIAKGMGTPNYAPINRNVSF